MLVLPHTVGSLTLHRKLGTGSVAESYLATQGDGKTVLARRLLTFISRDPNRIASINGRVAELSGFRHPSLVHVSGAVQEGGETIIIEEFMEGVSLDRLVAAARNQGVQLPPHLFLHIAVQVCNALEALHSRPSTAGGESVLHLGLKPGAVFVGVDGKVVVGSFGLTRSPSALPQGGVAGPVAMRMEYLSPEQTHSDQQLTPASDLFSLGAVLYELLTLESLFRAESNLQTIHRIRRGEVTSQLLKVKARMPGLDKVLYRALSVNPKHRYQRAFVLREDLRGLMAGYSFASVNEDARTWLAPLFDEGVRSVGLATAGAERPHEPVLVERTRAGLVGLDDAEELSGVGDAETTDIGFFPAGLPESEAPVARQAALTLIPDEFPDPTASRSGGSQFAPAPTLAPPEPAPAAVAPRQPLSLVGLGDQDEDDPDSRTGGTLLPEQFSAENTAAWIAGPGQGRPMALAPVDSGAGSENTASFLPAEVPDNTAAHIPAPMQDPASAFGEERTLTQTGYPPSRSTIPPVAHQPAPLLAPRSAPAPLLPSPVPPAAAVAASPPAAVPVKPPAGGPPARTMPPPRSAPPPLSPPPPFEEDAYGTPPPSRVPVMASAVAVGLVAILVCAGAVWGISEYAVDARAERVAQAMKDAAPPVVQVMDDPAATMAAPDAPTEPATELAAAPTEPVGPVVAAPAAPAAPALPAPVAAAPVATPVSAPAPVVAPAPVRPAPAPTPRPSPVAAVEPRPAPTPTPVVRPAPAPTPVPVSRVEPVSRPVASVTPAAAPRPVAPALIAAPVESGDDVLSVGSSGLNLDALATDARTGKLRADDAAALAVVPLSDPGYSRAQALLLSNAQKKGDKAATERALTALFALPENGYNPQYLAADALLLVNSGQYDRALTRAQQAEKYWSRLPPAQSFAMRAQIYEVEAASWQGKFYNSGGDLGSLDSAIRAWEKYNAHVGTQSRADLQKNGEAQIAKLRDIRTRVQ